MTADTVAYLGPPGTYTEAAALAFQPETARFSPYPTFPATLQAVAKGEVRWGVVAVENSVEGGVSATLDTLWQLEGLQIHQAQVLPIRHALLSSATELAEVKVVYSHPQALAQCQQWLSIHMPEALLVPVASNTSEMERLQTDPTAAAIAPERAAQVYGIPIVARAINDYDTNCTRFWTIGREPAPGGTHTSLAFSTHANVPGALLQPLQVFARHQVNMTRIESRPTKREIGDYVFFIDLEHPPQPTLVAEILEELRTIVAVLKSFGSYPLRTSNGELDGGDRS
jgi:prephenate dehydratase